MLLLCSRYGKVVILNVVKSGINTVSCLPFFKAQWRLRHSGSSNLPESSITISIVERELACFVYLCDTRYTLKLLTWALFIRPCRCVHMFSFHAWPFAFMLQVT